MHLSGEEPSRIAKILLSYLGNLAAKAERMLWLNQVDEEGVFPLPDGRQQFEIVNTCFVLVVSPF